jgi:uncharacterized protein (DUF2141 family)
VTRSWLFFTDVGGGERWKADTPARMNRQELNLDPVRYYLHGMQVWQIVEGARHHASYHVTVKIPGGRKKKGGFGSSSIIFTDASDFRGNRSAHLSQLYSQIFQTH